MSVKCGGCGLINAAEAGGCRRCGAPLGGALAQGAGMAMPPPGGYGYPAGPPIGVGPYRPLDAPLGGGDDPRDVALRVSARNWLIVAAVLKGAPVIAATFIVASSPRPIDDTGRGMMVGMWLFFLMLVGSAVLVGQGKKIGMWLAALPLMVMLCGFPIGSLFAIVIAKKVSAAAEAGALK